MSSRARRVSRTPRRYTRAAQGAVQRRELHERVADREEDAVDLRVLVYVRVFSSQDNSASAAAYQ
jgi:hypothetical protein